MLFTDYKWTASADHDNPNFLKGKEHTSLNRTEGYEMLRFINYLANEWGWAANVHVSNYQKIERLIRKEVPSNTQTHAAIRAWLASNWKNHA